MTERVPGKRRLRSTIVALVAASAMLIAPFCGRLCSSQNGCGAHAAAANSEDCHHEAGSVGSDSEATALASAKSCSQQDLPDAILASTETWSSFDRITAFAVTMQAIAAGVPLDVNLSILRPLWRASGHPPQASPPVTSTSVLRI